MTRRLTTILIVSQFLFDLLILANFWTNRMWQVKVTEIVEQLLQASSNAT